MNVTAADISRYKRQKQYPHSENLERMAVALEVDVLTLLIGLGAIDGKAVTSKVPNKSRAKDMGIATTEGTKSPLKLMTAITVGELFGVTPAYVLKLARQGVLPSRKIGKFIRFTEEDVSQFIRSLPTQ